MRTTPVSANGVGRGALFGEAVPIACCTRATRVRGRAMLGCRMLFSLLHAVTVLCCLTVGLTAR